MKYSAVNDIKGVLFMTKFLNNTFIILLKVMSMGKAVRCFCV